MGKSCCKIVVNPEDVNLDIGLIVGQVLEALPEDVQDTVDSGEGPPPASGPSNTESNIYCELDADGVVVAKHYWDGSGWVVQPLVEPCEFRNCATAPDGTTVAYTIIDGVTTYTTITGAAWTGDPLTLV